MSLYLVGAAATPAEEARAKALVLAKANPSDFVVVATINGQPADQGYPTLDEALDRFNALYAMGVEKFDYVGVFNKKDPRDDQGIKGSWPDPLQEFGTAIMTLVVNAPAPRKKSGGGIWGWLIGGLAGVGLVTAASKKRKKVV